MSPRFFLPPNNTAVSPKSSQGFMYADVEIEIDFFDPNRMRFVVA